MDLLIIIDMQEAYDIGGEWECENIVAVKENIKYLINKFKSQDIVCTRFIAPDNPIGTWKNYNNKYDHLNNSKLENKLMSEFKDFRAIDKCTYSCYKNIEVKQLIDYYDRVVICGVVADCCILSTVLDIIDTGKPIIYINDAIGECGKGSLEAVNKIMENMQLHVKSISYSSY